MISHVLEHHRVCRVSDYPVVFGSSLDPLWPKGSAESDSGGWFGFKDCFQGKGS